MPVSSSNISFCRGGVTASPTCLCGCVSIHIKMYMVYRLQVTLSHVAFLPASIANEIVTWWEGRNFLDQGLQGGHGLTQCWGSGSCAAPEQTKTTAGAKVLSQLWMHPSSDTLQVWWDWLRQGIYGYLPWKATKSEYSHPRLITASRLLPFTAAHDAPLHDYQGFLGSIFMQHGF